MRKLLFILMLSVIPAHAAIAFDTSGGPASNACGNSATCTWAHTVATGSSDLWVGFIVDGNAGAVSSVTCNGGGGTMTQIKTATETAGNMVMYLYHFFSPTSGSNTILITLASGPGNTRFMAGSMSFTLGDTSALDNGTGASALVGGGGANTISLNLTTNNANAIIVDVFLSYNNGTTYTPNSPQVQVFNTSGVRRFGMSYRGPVVTPASTSDGWSWTGGADNAGLLAASMKPSTASGGAGKQVGGFLVGP